MSANAPLIAEATDLAKRWADSAGLQPVSFTLSSSELVVVRGRSGSGKSTLLALLAGWIAPDGGTLVRLGAWGANGIDRTWRGTAILPQVIAPIAELTMTENVALPLRLSGSTRHVAGEHARQMLDRLDLTDEADRAASDASLGQQQRMALARAAVVEPIVLLADEPTSHQDAGHIATVLELLAIRGRRRNAASSSPATIRPSPTSPTVCSTSTAETNSAGPVSRSRRSAPGGLRGTTSTPPGRSPAALGRRWPSPATARRR